MVVTIAQGLYSCTDDPGAAYGMVSVAGGTFTMGCTGEQGPDCYEWEKPAHRVSLSGFKIGKYEVTEGFWKSVMGNLPPEMAGRGTCDNCPVTFVSWHDTQQFIQVLNQQTGLTYRLPTEAEWEFAARGGIKSRNQRYPGGNTPEPFAWYSDNANNTTQPVGKKLPNELGIYDMAGNAWEWCQDWYGPDTCGQGNRTNPQGLDEGIFRIKRGGPYFDAANFSRTACCFTFGPHEKRRTIGFRLAMDL